MAAVCLNFDKVGTAFFGGKFLRNVGWKRCCVRSTEFNEEVVYQCSINTGSKKTTENLYGLGQLQDIPYTN